MPGTWRMAKRRSPERLSSGCVAKFSRGLWKLAFAYHTRQKPVTGRFLIETVLCSRWWRWKRRRR